MVRCFLVRPSLSSKRLLVIAAQSIANVVKSSLGPLGLDKMLVDNIGVSICCDVIILRSYVPLGSHHFQRWRDYSIFA